MDQNQLLNFENFIREYYPEHIIDECNVGVIRDLSLWAFRDTSFEDSKRGLYLDKGILITGSVGSGKTDLFNILRTYLHNYIRSKYYFSYGVVWKFTSDFSKDGYEAFEGQDTGNRYYDELCLTDSRTKFPNKEMGMHYGSKILIGEELIMFRYNSFKRLGYQTHFSTNATIGELSDIYGERAFSRLSEMCNFFTLTGDDRRLSGAPNIYKNVHVPPSAAKPIPTGVDHEAECKGIIEECYSCYLSDKEVSVPYALIFKLLFSVKIQPNYSEYKENIEQAKKEYVPEFSRTIRSAEEMVLIKNREVETNAQVIFVKKLFANLKENKSPSVFGERIVNMDALISENINSNEKDKL